MTVAIEDKGGNCSGIGMSNSTWFTILDIPGVGNLFNNQKLMTRLTVPAPKHGSWLT